NRGGEGHPGGLRVIGDLAPPSSCVDEIQPVGHERALGRRCGEQAAQAPGRGGWFEGYAEADTEAALEHRPVVVPPPERVRGDIREGAETQSQAEEDALVRVLENGDD